MFEKLNNDLDYFETYHSNPGVTPQQDRDLMPISTGSKNRISFKKTDLSVLTSPSNPVASWKSVLRSWDQRKGKKRRGKIEKTVYNNMVSVTPRFFIQGLLATPSSFISRVGEALLEMPWSWIFHANRRVNNSQVIWHDCCAISQTTKDNEDGCLSESEGKQICAEVGKICIDTGMGRQEK